MYQKLVCYFMVCAALLCPLLYGQSQNSGLPSMEQNKQTHSVDFDVLAQLMEQAGMDGSPPQLAWWQILLQYIGSYLFECYLSCKQRFIAVTARLRAWRTIREARS